MDTPIVNARREIVGFAKASPEVIGNTVRHAHAERLLGGAVKAVYIEIEEPAALLRAGAPRGWKGTWRCLALCSAETVTVDPEDGTAIVRIARQHARTAARVESNA